MNPELEFKSEEDRIKFQEVLQHAFANMSNYEKKSLEIIINLMKSTEQLKDNKLRMTKYLVEDINELLNLVKISNGKPEDIRKMMDEIKALQSNISSYMETSDEDVLESIKRNIKEINEINQVITKTKKEDLTEEERKEQEELKKNELRYLSERQNVLNHKVRTEITKELKKLKSNRKPFDFKKLDKAYRNLYIAIEKEDKEEIINKRGRLIRLLEANKKEIEEQYTVLKPLEEIKIIFESEETKEIKLQRINEILRGKDSLDYAYYFNNVNNYEELKQEFYNLYEFLEVNKTRLYKEALKEELKTHGVELKEAYSHELIDKKHQSSTLTQALPMTMGLSIQKLSNTMTELRNTKSKRKQKELRKEALSDFGRVIATPIANIAKFTANNWYTLSLLNNGYKTAKEQKEAEDKARAEAAAAAATEVPTEEATQDPPAHVGAQYADPEFEEEVIKLMKSGEYNSTEEAEHQALINLGRIEPEPPQSGEPPEVEPDEPRELGLGPIIPQPEIKNKFATREEAIDHLMQNPSMTREIAERIVNTGIKDGNIQVGPGVPEIFPGKKIPVPKPLPINKGGSNEVEPDEPREITGVIPAVIKSDVRTEFATRDEAVDHLIQNLNITKEMAEGIIEKGIENGKIHIGGAVPGIFPGKKIPLPKPLPINKDVSDEVTPEEPKELTGRSPIIPQPEIKNKFATREEAIDHLMQNPSMTREIAERIVNTGIKEGSIQVGPGVPEIFPGKKIPVPKPLPINKGGSNEVEPDEPREITGVIPEVIKSDVRTEFATRDEAVDHLMQNLNITQEMAEGIIEKGIENGKIHIGGAVPGIFPGKKIPLPKPLPINKDVSNEVTPEDPKELTGRSPIIPQPEIKNRFATREEAIDYLMQNPSMTREIAERIVNTGIKDGNIQVGPFAPRLFPGRKMPAPKPLPNVEGNAELETPELINNDLDREKAIGKLQQQNPNISRQEAERIIDYIKKTSGKDMSEIPGELQRGQNAADKVKAEREKNAYYRTEAAKGLMKFAPDSWKTMDEALERIDQMVQDDPTRSYQIIAEQYEQWNGEYKVEAIEAYSLLTGVPREEAEAFVEANKDIMTYHRQYEMYRREQAIKLYGGNAELIDGKHFRLFGRAYSDIYTDLTGNPKEVAMREAQNYFEYNGQYDVGAEEIEQLVEAMAEQADALGEPSPYLYVAAALDEATPDSIPNGYETVSGEWKEVPLETEGIGLGIGLGIPWTDIHLPKILAVYRDNDGWHCSIEDYPEGAEAIHPVVELVNGLVNSK